MEILELKVQTRKTGKGVARRARSEARVPAVFYGPKIKDPFFLTVNSKEIKQILQANASSLLKLVSDSNQEVNGRIALIKERQKDPVTREYVHLDLMEVDLSKEITIRVPIKLEGKSQGVKDGGILEQTERELEIICRADSIPQAIVVDISALAIGENMHVSDITLPQGVRPADEINRTIVSIVSPTEISEAVTPVTEVKEPEVIGAAEKAAKEEAEKAS